MRARTRAWLLLPLLPVLARAADPACRGTLSGSVTGAFTCDAGVATGQDGKSYFVIQPRGPIEGVPAYAPGAFEIPVPPRAGTYTLADLGMGKASVAAEGGTFYSATRTTGQRGEVKLVLRSVEATAGAKGAWVVHGSYRARLPPAGGGKAGEVIVEVTF